MSFRREWLPNDTVAQIQRCQEAERLEFQAEVLTTALVNVDKRCKGTCEFRAGVGDLVKRYQPIASELRDRRRHWVPVLVKAYGILDAVEEK